MKRIIGKVLYNKKVASLLIKPTLILHSKLYSLIGRLAIIREDGLHPKHRILKYKEWFLENITPQDVVLDIGCDKGLMAFLIASKSKFVYGIDINCKAIEAANREKLEKGINNVKFFCSDAVDFNYNFLKYPIDVVTLSNVLEHIQNRIEFLITLNSIIKWNHNPRYLIRVPMIDRDWVTLYKKELGLDYRLDKTHYIEYTFEEFKNELEKAGIKIEKYQIKFGEIYAICEGIMRWTPKTAPHP